MQIGDPVNQSVASCESLGSLVAIALLTDLGIFGAPSIFRKQGHFSRLPHQPPHGWNGSGSRQRSLSSPKTLAHYRLLPPLAMSFRTAQGAAGRAQKAREREESDLRTKFGLDAWKAADPGLRALVTLGEILASAHPDLALAIREAVARAGTINDVVEAALG
jgi:hypothetical protein